MVDASDLDEMLLAAGASPDDIEEAGAGGWLPLLALDRRLMPGTPKYDLGGLAAAADVDLDTTRRLWRALGFPDVPSGIPMFTDSDAAALRVLLNRDSADFNLEHDDLARTAEQVRVVSGALARVAALEADEVAAVIDRLRAGGASEREVASAVIDSLAWDDLAALVDYTHRIQLRAALWRRLAQPTSAPVNDLCVGFADIAGYTELAEELSDDELAELLSRFEAHAYDTVAANGARIVKTIGDAVMFVGSPMACAHAALALAEPQWGVPPLCQGLAYGPLLARDGDYFGPVVNLASRLTRIARPSTVVVSESLHTELAAAAGLRWRAMRARRLKGIGEVHPFVVRRETSHA